MSFAKREPNALFANSCAARVVKGAEKGLTRKTAIFLRDWPSRRPIFRIFRPQQDLCKARGKGRDDYPVQTLWGVVLLSIALRHTGFEACLGELRRNPTLRRGPCTATTA